MDAQELDQATQSLVQAVQQSANDAGTKINADMALLAPGLATGTTAPGGYNFNADIAPVVDPLAREMVVASKGAVLKQALKDATNVAQLKYDDANYAYRQRQRDWTKKKALEAEARQRKYDSQAFGGGGGGGLAGAAAGSNVSGVNTTATNNFIGKDDYRGRLAYMAQQGNAQAKLALQYVGNDGKYYINLKNPPNHVQDWPKIIASLNAMGATNAWKG